MALEGTIKDFAIADILQLIGIQRKTGLLTLDNGKDVVTVRFLEGHVVGAETKLRGLEDFLGSVLVRTGRISEEQLSEALRVQRSTMQRLGFILLKSGVLRQDDLKEALRIQVSQIVFRLFRWRDGRYHFTATEMVDHDPDLFTPIGAETILMEGARMIDEWPIIERRVRSSGVVFRATPAAAAWTSAPEPLLGDGDVEIDRPEASERGSARVRVSDDEGRVLRMVDGRSTVGEIVDRMPLGEFDVYRILCDLANRRLIEEVRLESKPSGQKRDETRPGVARVASTAVLFVLAAIGLAFGDASPIAPWSLAGGAREGARFKTYASQDRLERIHAAIGVFYLDRGALPARLDGLVRGGYLRSDDLLDPWGRPYAYRVVPGGLEIAGSDEAGNAAEALTVQKRFRAAQRLAMEGGSDAGLE